MADHGKILERYQARGGVVSRDLIDRVLSKDGAFRPLRESR